MEDKSEVEVGKEEEDEDDDLKQGENWCLFAMLYICNFCVCFMTVI